MVSKIENRAIQAAVGIAGDLGLVFKDPVVLRVTNNVVLWLQPLMLVARVGHGHRGRMQLELDVAAELALLGAPVVGPAVDLPKVVHARDGFDLTFWPYFSQSQASDLLPPSEIAAGLRTLHAALQRLSPRLRDGLPSFRRELEDVGELLRDSTRLRALIEEDRLLLLHAFQTLESELRKHHPPEWESVIHGSPHRLNILNIGGQARFIDFETTCGGPIEWDLAHVEAEVADHYRDVNYPLLQTCQHMISVKTAAWCWAGVDRGDLRHHAEVHLDRVKRIFVP